MTMSQALPSIVGSARQVREYDGVWNRTCEKQTRQKGTGLGWQEFTIGQVNSQDITETTENNNSVTLAGTLQSITPELAQVLLKMTDRARETLSPNVVAQIGSLTGNAMRRKRDEDYLAIASTLATTASPGTGNPVSFGHISAWAANIRGNVTEGAEDELYGVLHAFQAKDIQDEIVAGVGTYTIPPGMTEQVFKQGFMGSIPITGVNIFIDNNIAIDSTPDANGMVHARKGVVIVQGMGLRSEMRRDPAFGGGADEAFITDEYTAAERTSRGTQVFAGRILSDATAPTS